MTLGIVYADDVARLHQDMLDMLDNGLRTIAQSFTNSGHEEGHDRYQYRALQDLFWRSGLPVHFDQNWTPEPMPMAVHMISPPEPSFGNCFTYNYNPPFQEPASVNGNQYLTPPVQDSRHHCDVYPEAHPRPPFQDQGFNSINNVLTTPANHHPGAASEYYALQGHQGGRSETENTLDRMMFKHRSKQICENVHEAVLETVYQLVRFRGIRL